jgi:hypothetical protein
MQPDTSHPLHFTTSKWPDFTVRLQGTMRSGKDYAHATHQALLAHGHGLQAIDHGDDAGTYFAEHGGKALPKYPKAVPRFPLKSLEPAGSIRADPSGAERSITPPPPTTTNRRRDITAKPQSTMTQRNTCRRRTKRKSRRATRNNPSSTAMKPRRPCRALQKIGDLPPRFRDQIGKALSSKGACNVVERIGDQRVCGHRK